MITKRRRFCRRRCNDAKRGGALLLFFLVPIEYSSTTFSSWVSDKTSVLLLMLLPNNTPCCTELNAHELASSMRADRIAPDTVIISVLLLNGGECFLFQGSYRCGSCAAEITLQVLLRNQPKVSRRMFF